MTKRQTEILCKAVGVPCRWDSEWKEFIVGKVTNGIDGRYFTDCPYDAVDTAIAMRQSYRKEA